MKISNEREAVCVTKQQRHGVFKPREAVLCWRALRKQEIEFRTYLLPRDYSSFGQNPNIIGKAA